MLLGQRIMGHWLNANILWDHFTILPFFCTDYTPCRAYYNPGGIFKDPALKNFNYCHSNFKRVTAVVTRRRTLLWLISESYDWRLLLGRLYRTSEKTIDTLMVKTVAWLFISTPYNHTKYTYDTILSDTQLNTSWIIFITAASGF